MSNIEVRTVSSKKDLMQFIKLPWKIYQNDPHWVPPLILDRKNLLDKKKNPFYAHAEMEMFLAYKNNELVGRIAAITNENHNKFHQDNVGFFGFFESTDDKDVSDALFTKSEKWLREREKDIVWGPMNPSTNDEVGLLIKGFDSPPYVMMCHNPEYYGNLIESQGYEKAKDLYDWQLDIRGMKIPDKILQLAELSSKKYDLTIRNVDIKNMTRDIQFIREIYNDAWSRNWGFVPFTNEEIDHMAADLKQIVIDEFVLLAFKDDRPIGFLLCIPNINEILIKNRSGRLFPAGIFRLLIGMKKIKTVRTITLGIVKDLQHIGLGTILYTELIRRAQRRNLDGGEMSWILEDNEAMNRPIEMLGSKLYKIYRVYQKKL
ncbi:MAG: GNAT family N-acetyltransferase [Calditrichia bacterium]|nr:GNAT family N-acetyltransferase [Calditrichia bacterium]